MRKWLAALLCALLLASLCTACGWPENPEPGVPEAEPTETAVLPETGETADPVPEAGEAADPVPDSMPEAGETDAPDEAGTYTSKDDVARYLHAYGRLPGNFITKREARALGWNGGSLEPYAPGKCIGGDRFGNYEGLLPEGHTWTECDIDTLGASGRGAKRIVFSDDGLIYYTGDHYTSFTLLYGEETP